MDAPFRSFVAFCIDDEKVWNKLSNVQERLVNTGANLKLVKPVNVHVTMRFLGDIQPFMVENIHRIMMQVAFTPFEVEIRGLGAFPTLKYARVVWAGISKGVEHLKVIFDQLEPRLRKLGFKPDKKGFSPHLTIARVRTGRNKAELARCISELADYEFGVSKFECLKLKKSVLTPEGPIYSTLKEVCP